MNKLQTMNFYDLLTEVIKEGDFYREFFDNEYSKRNKKQLDYDIDQENHTSTTKIKREKNIFIFLDTCTWINHAEKANFDALTKIFDLHRQKDAILLVPEQLTIEWNRNSEEKLLKKQLNTFNEMINKTKAFRDVAVLDSSKKEVLDDLIHQSELYRDDILTNINKEIIYLFSDVMRSGRDFKTKNAHLIEAAKMALEKKAPFHKGKNSMGDAVLFISLMEFLEKSKKPTLYFITDNTTDFSGDKVHELHQDLRKIAEEKGITLIYSLDLNKTLDTIIKEVTDTNYVQSYQKKYYEKYHVNFKNRCKECQGRMIMNTHRWNGRGSRIFYQCEQCNNVKETNQYYEDYIEDMN